MIHIDNVIVGDFEGAIRSMRNAMDSWDKSDSFPDNDLPGNFHIGEMDMSLAQRLIRAGSSDRKFLRMIHVTFDVTATQTLWSQLDTYKVATTKNSCSKMHTLHKKNLTLESFSHEYIDQFDHLTKTAFSDHIAFCEMLRNGYLTTKNPVYWQALLEALPMSYMLRATLDLNYETLMHIYFDRRNHKLHDWQIFCKWIVSLPYMENFIRAAEKKIAQ